MTQEIVIDVRTPAEFAAGHLEGAIPLDVRGEDFLEAIGRLRKDLKYLVYCRTGGRSRYAVGKMRALGLDARNLDGGIRALQGKDVRSA